MTSKNRGAIRRLGFESLAVTVLYIILTIACVVFNAGRLDIYLPEGNSAEDFYPEHGLVEIRTDRENERHMKIVAKGRGKEFIFNGRESSEIVENDSFEYVKVLPGGMIFDMSNGNFSGWKQHIILFEIYLFIITILLVTSFLLRCRTELFSYNTLYFGGTALFLMSMSADLLIGMVSMGDRLSMMNIYSVLKNSGSVFMVLTLPVMLIFSVSLIASNSVLIRREGRSFVNLLGLILCVLIVGGYIVYFIISEMFLSGSEREVCIFNAVTSIYSTAFVYFEAMLISASLCGIIAARKKTACDKTHIIILGCAIADDGTPLPLLRGRIDRAIEFARAQKAAGGGDVRFVPSGGKGSDEVIAEAESMRDYLISQGIAEEQILLENRSATTRENMRFSLEKISADCKDPRIVFSTSGYHVLRSGIISRNEGLEADGIGSRTKWYFFPNAFVREFVGLLASKRRQHAFWIVFFIAIFVLMNIIMPM